VGAAGAKAVPMFIAKNQFKPTFDCLDVNIQVGELTYPNNGCSTQTIVLVAPLPVEFTGAKTVTVTRNAPAANPTASQCAAFGAAFDRTMITISPHVGSATTGRVPLVLQGASVPGGGHLWVRCELVPTHGLTDAVYNE
jgi:hypothetical protein